jgi:uncharacterized membrane protein YfcA
LIIVELIIFSIAVGIGAGILIGMLGIGGGIIFVPFFYFILPSFGVTQEFIPYFAIGTSLLSGAIAASYSAGNHFLKKNLNLKNAIILSAGSVIASIVTPYFVVHTNASILHVIFAVVFIFVAIRMFLFNGDNNKTSKKINLPKFYLFGFGLAIGTVSAFSGIGGGLLYFPTLVYLFDTEVKPAIGTSSFATAGTMIFSALSFSQQQNSLSVEGSIGYILIVPGLLLGVFASIGSYFGVKLAINSKDKLIKKIFAIVLIIAVLKIILDI